MAQVVKDHDNNATMDLIRMPNTFCHTLCRDYSSNREDVWSADRQMRYLQTPCRLVVVEQGSYSASLMMECGMWEIWNDGMWEIWKTLFVDVLNKHAPIQSKRIRKRGNVPWLNGDVKAKLFKRDNLKKRQYEVIMNMTGSYKGCLGMVIVHCA